MHGISGAKQHLIFGFADPYPFLDEDADSDLKSQTIQYTMYIFSEHYLYNIHESIGNTVPET